MNAPSNIWVNPKTVVKLFTKTILYQNPSPTNEQISKIIRTKGLRLTAEAWRAAMYLIALEKLNPDINYFLQPNPNDPPDFYSIDLFLENGILLGYEREIEVFEYPNESVLTLEQEIDKKIHKQYSPKTILVCHITRETFAARLGDIHNAVKELNPKNEIWIIASLNDGAHQSVAMVYPNLVQVKIDIKEVFDMKIEHTFIESGRGKSHSFIFTDSKKTALLTPKFNIISTNTE